MKRWIPFASVVALVATFAVAQVIGGGGSGAKSGTGTTVINGRVDCNVASPSAPGCVFPQAQTFLGPKGITMDGGSNDTYPLYLRQGKDMSAGSQSIGICFGGTPTVDGTTCTGSRAAVLTFGSDTYMRVSNNFGNLSAGVLNWAGEIRSANSGGAAISATSGYFRSNGVLEANLPTCNGGAAGALIYTTDRAEYAYCDGTNWQFLAAQSPTKYFDFAAQCAAADTCTAEETVFLGSGQVWDAATDGVCVVSCNFGTTGVVGGASLGIQMEVVDETGSNVAVCNLGNGATDCDLTARDSITGLCTGTSTFIAGRAYRLQLSNATDCGTNPSNWSCNVTCSYTPTP